MDIMIAGEL